MKDIQQARNFYSDKDLSRFEYIKRSFLLIVLILISHAIFYLKPQYRDTSPNLLWIIDIIMGGGFLIWVLTKKITTQIQFDFEKQKLIVYYLTILRTDKNLEISFINLSFTFTKHPTRSDPTKWTLILFDNKKEAFSMDSNEDGFSLQTLENITTELPRYLH
jgi:hypothetical protein